LPDFDASTCSKIANTACCHLSLQAVGDTADRAAAFAALSHAPSLQQQLARLQRPAQEQSASVAPPSLESSQQLIADGLQAVAGFMAKAVQPATFAAQNRHVAELQRWLVSNLPGVTLANIPPELLGVYLTQHWLLNHTGSVLPSGEHIVAPASLATMLSHLSSYFQRVEGRTGDYQLQQGVPMGNPVRSSLIMRLRKGYFNEMREKGVSQGAAVPVNFELVEQLLESLAAELQDAEPGTLHAALLARDGFLVSVLWHTALRGDNAGRLRDTDCINTDGEPVCSLLWSAGYEPPPGLQLCFRPDGTKSLRAANCGRVDIEALSVLDRYLCCVWWLQQLGLEYAAFANKPLCGFLTRPLLPSRLGFADKPVSSSDLNKMIQRRQQQYGVGGTATPHGFRRGRLQQLKASGHSLTAITAHALNKTEATIQQRYLNLDAHLNTLPRARS
jgi:hypothetical protein